MLWLGHRHFRHDQYISVYGRCECVDEERSGYVWCAALEKLKGMGLVSILVDLHVEPSRRGRRVVVI